LRNECFIPQLENCSQPLVNQSLREARRLYRLVYLMTVTQYVVISTMADMPVPVSNKPKVAVPPRPLLRRNTAPPKPCNGANNKAEATKPRPANFPPARHKDTSLPPSRLSFSAGSCIKNSAASQPSQKPPTQLARSRENNERTPEGQMKMENLMTDTASQDLLKSPDRSPTLAAGSVSARCLRFFC